MNIRPVMRRPGPLPQISPRPGSANRNRAGIEFPVLQNTSFSALPFARR